MTTSEISIVILIGLNLGAILIGILLYRLSMKPKDKHYEIFDTAKNRVRDSIQYIVEDAFNDVSSTDFFSVTDYLDALLKNIFKQVYEFVSGEIDSICSEDKDRKIVNSILKKKSKDDLAIDIIEDEKLTDIRNHAIVLFAKTYTEKFESMEKEDEQAARVAEAYENGTAKVPAYNGEFDKSEFEKGRESFMPIKPSKEELASLEEVIEETETVEEE